MITYKIEKSKDEVIKLWINGPSSLIYQAKIRN